MQFLPPLLALSAAILFGLLVHVQRRAVLSVDEITGALVSLTSTALCYWVLAAFSLDWAWFETRVFWVLVAVGFVFPAGSQILQIVSVRRIGASLTSAVGSFTPLWAAIPAVIWLGEVVSWKIALGMGLMMAALMLAALAPKSFRSGWPVWALALPLGASFVRGVVQPITKAGYAEVPSPIFATVVMVSVSTLVLAVIWLASRRVAPTRADAAGLGWFAFSGVINAVAILALFRAFQLADVSVIAPLASTAPVFALLLSAVVFRSEALRARHVGVVCLSVGGAVLLVSS